MKRDTMSVQEFRKKFTEGKPKGMSMNKNRSGRNRLDAIRLVLVQEGHDVIMEHAFHPTRRWRFDMAIPKHKIAVEYEGIFCRKSRHTSVTGYAEDCEKYNEAQMLGWKVIRVTAKNMTGLYPKIQRMIQRNS